MAFTGNRYKSGSCLRDRFTMEELRPLMNSGHGNFSGSSTADFGGSAFPVAFTGTYTVNANCTGSLTADAGPSGINHRDLVIVDAGKEVEFVSTDPGLVIAGYMKKQRWWRIDLSSCGVLCFKRTQSKAGF